LSLRAAACGIDLNCLHEREVDHKAIIADRCAGTTVSASTDCDEKLVLARISQCDDDLCAKRDQRRSMINPSVPDLSNCLVSDIVWRQDAATQALTNWPQG
jgi:hypothetical protein